MIDGCHPNHLDGAAICPAANGASRLLLSIVSLWTYSNRRVPVPSIGNANAPIQ
jgi:hypothetical protein